MLTNTKLPNEYIIHSKQKTVDNRPDFGDLAVVSESTANRTHLRSVVCFSVLCPSKTNKFAMDDEEETYKLWRIRKTVMQVRVMLI